MDQIVTERRPQLFFAFLNEAQPPTFAPLDDVAQFESEVDAINYSVDHILRQRRGLTQMQLADEMKMTRAVLTKLRQGQVGVPVRKFLTFIETTKNFALLQFWSMRLGLVLKTQEQEKADQQRTAHLEAQLADLETRYKRVVGE